MATYGAGPAGVTTISPPARESLTKVGILEPSDGVSTVELFGLPKYAVIMGVYTIALGANTTQTIACGFKGGVGNEVINAFAPNATGYSTTGAQTGTAVGTQLTADKIVKAQASAQLTNPVLIKVEYWIPPQGEAR